MEPSEEYIGNPFGDIYLLVIADRIAVGGLAAETAGETRITDSFVLVTVEDSLEEIDIWSGGMTGILGAGTRVENSYTAGLLDTRGVTGGFAAVNDGEIQNCYSTVVLGTEGAVRGAFTASGNGRLSGCFYDRQMACVEEERSEDGQRPSNLSEAERQSASPLDAERLPASSLDVKRQSAGSTETVVLPASPADAMEAEFSLLGLDTSSMAGIGASIPGIWYQTENAYPQLEAFAQSENEIAASNSKASAIALMLPEGVTLLDVLNDSTLVLPASVDGDEIQWEVEGDANIDENNQIKIGVNAGISRQEAPIVGAAIQKENTETTKVEQTEAQSEEQSEAQLKEQNTSIKQIDTSDIRLKAIVGTAIRKFTLNAARRGAGIDYADWGTVGEAIYNGTETGVDFIPTLSADEYYEIKTPEALAWFAYVVNHVENAQSINGRLMNDIDLNGSQNDWTTSVPLKWIPIGLSTSKLYDGIFDGGKHTIHNLKSDRALFGYLKNAKLKNIILSQVNIEDIDGGEAAGIALNARGTSYLITGCGVESGTIKGITNCGSILCNGAAGKGTVSDCYNKAQIMVTHNAKGKTAGGIVARFDRGELKIERCYNWGDIFAPTGIYDCHGGGICSYGFGNITIDSCYNIGKITGYSESGFCGGITGATVLTMSDGRGKVTNSYNLLGMGSYTTDNGTQLSETALKSWATAFALNKQSMDGVWAYIPGQYPNFGTLARPDSWQDVGQGVIDGLVTGVTLENDSTTGNYKIGSAEQLATFAQKVNTGTDGAETWDVNLTMDINLAGERYGGTIASPIPWYPIGNETNVYKGTFDGAGKAIGYMRVEKDGFAGFIGCAGGGAVITGVGLDSSCRVTSTGTSSGNGTAALVALVKSDGTSKTQITIQNCYSRALVASAGTASATGTFVGTVTGTLGGGEKIANCYNTGTITVSGNAGAIAGTFTHGAGGGIKNCYWDSQTSGTVSSAEAAGSAMVENCGGRTTVVMKSDGASGILDMLNANLGTGTWYRVNTRNDGYPIFKKSESEITWADVGAAVMAPQSKNASASPGTASDPYLIWPPENLAWFSYQVNQLSGSAGLCAELMTDLDLFGGTYSGHAYDTSNSAILSKALLWIPIGDGAVSYTGTFQGNGHTVRAMRAGSTTDENQGLFGTIGDGAQITGLGVADSQISAARYGGGLSGRINGTGVAVSDCQITGKLTGQGDYFGGIAGAVSGTGITVIRCRNTGSIEGTGNYIGGIAGAAQSSESVVIEACYSSTAGKTGTTGHSKTNIGGILGAGLTGIGTVTVRNCYNQGIVSTGSSGSQAGGIVGSAVQNTEIRGCYNSGQITGSSACQSIAGMNTGSGNISYCLYQNDCSVDINAKSVTQAGLKTWGAAFYLNGAQLKQSTGISWDTPAGASACPEPFSAKLKDADNWEAIGEAVNYGLIGTVPTGNPYEIGTAEQLAWLAYRVNCVSGEAGTKAYLTTNIDLSTNESKYVSSGHLSWMPIGKNSTTPYTGALESRLMGSAGSTENKRTIFEIQNLYTETAGPAGVFGVISGSGTVTRVGVSGGMVTGTEDSSTRAAMAGGIAGKLAGNSVITQCYNQSDSIITANGTTAYAGGIVGQMSDSAKVKDCYHLDSEVSSTGNTTYAGGIAGDGGTSGIIGNCYSACGKPASSAKITASGTGAARSITGTGGRISQCYSEAKMSGEPAEVAEFDLSTNEKIWEQIDGINTVDRAERTGDSRIWFTSLASEAARGLPTFVAPVMVEITLEPATADTGTTKNLGTTVNGAVLRGIHQETGPDVNVTLTSISTVVSSFKTYGTTNANQNLAFGADSTDISTLASSLLKPMASLGNFSQLTLYNGGAYTLASGRVILLDVSSGSTRYEIRASIPGVTSKTLSVTLPSKVDMVLEPGVKTKAYSAALALKNESICPIQAVITKAIEQEDKEAKLKPIASDITISNTTPLTEAGVKLGIEGSFGSAGSFADQTIYYNPGNDTASPAVPSSWMTCNIGSGQTLNYKYFMEHSLIHVGPEMSFGFDITYQIRIPEKDVGSEVTAVET